MILLKKIIIPHYDTCTVVKNPKKVGCVNLEIIESSLSFETEKDLVKYKSDLQKERGIKGITFLWTEV